MASNGEPYPNGDVASVMSTSFHTMRIDTVTWAVHNNMEEAKWDEEAGGDRE